MITMFMLHNQNSKFIPNCDVSFANGKLHQTVFSIDMQGMPQ